MGIFFGKNFAQVFFKTDDAGRRVFYRYGRFGKGYVVEPAQEREIETYIGRQFGWATALLFLQIAGQTALGIGTTLAILGIPYLVFLILFYRGLSRRIRGLPVSELRMTGADVVRNQAEQMSTTRVYVMVVASVVMTLASAVTAWQGLGAVSWIGAFGVVFFGFAFVQSLRIVKARWTGV